ncbi:anti-sigma-D factor RsdA [Amycolatopsis suaedae]|uniref:Anti-sigma-D factor RsdA sigma factor binding region domain-containing protein n=1 Tax=Amycolatopsis suaedae TaxID=2510978 RepID=A0A4Q7J8L2_9PSEU|nr:anti-sigma-D factor RsdA [Amycolatopsis suaedae]RZQ64041.1 hypothetical protein EWH70_08540 [Amycolatopsis suaedae]
MTDHDSRSRRAQDDNGTPDLSAVQADDALLDALGGPDPKVADALGDHELNALLLAWRRDIDSEPMGELLDTPTAVATVKTAAQTHRNGGRARKRRLLVPVAAAAAVLAIAFAGTGIAARDAQPGDPLWGLTKVLYADHARSVQAAATVRLDLEKANLAISEGRLDDARRALEEAQRALEAAGASEDYQQLKAEHKHLTELLTPPSPGGNNPPTGPGTGTTLSPTQSQGPTSSPDPRTTTTSSPTPPTSSTTTAPTTTPSNSSSGGEETSGGSKQPAGVGETP